MKNRGKNVALVAAGIMLGAAIAGPAAQAAEMFAAQRSAQKIVVDGKQAQIEAYSINGNNYAKIRDLGKAVGFNVSYDAATNTVQIDSDAPYQAETSTQVSRVVTLPTDGSKYVPKVGDLIPCDDGTLYEVKDVSRWESNVFMDGPMPDMPTPTCDWSLFPQPELPKVEVKHYSDQHGDDLFVTNLYELRRMEYTIRNALGKEPDAWRGDQLLAKIYLSIPPEYEPYTGTFWPWRESEDAVCQGYFRKKTPKTDASFPRLPYRRALWRLSRSKLDEMISSNGQITDRAQNKPLLREPFF